MIPRLSTEDRNRQIGAIFHQKSLMKDVQNKCSALAKKHYNVQKLNCYSYYSKNSKVFEEITYPHKYSILGNSNDTVTWVQKCLALKIQCEYEKKSFVYKYLKYSVIDFVEIGNIAYWNKELIQP